MKPPTLPPRPTGTSILEHFHALQAAKTASAGPPRDFTFSSRGLFGSAREPSASPPREDAVSTLRSKLAELEHATNLELGKAALYADATAKLNAEIEALKASRPRDENAEYREHVLKIAAQFEAMPNLERGKFFQKHADDLRAADVFRTNPSAHVLRRKK